MAEEVPDGVGGRRMDKVALCRRDRLPQGFGAGIETSAHSPLAHALSTRLTQYMYSDLDLINLESLDLHF